MIKKFLEYFNERLSSDTYFSTSKKLDTVYGHKGRSENIKRYANYVKYMEFLKTCKEKFKFICFTSNEESNNKDITKLNYGETLNTNGNFIIGRKLDRDDKSFFLSKIKLDLNIKSIIDDEINQSEIYLKTILTFIEDRYKFEPQTSPTVYIINIPIEISCFYDNDEQKSFDFEIDPSSTYINKCSPNDISSFDNYPTNNNAYYTIRKDAVKLKKFLCEYLKTEEAKNEIHEACNENGVSPSYYIDLLEYVDELNINSLYKG